MILGNPHKKAFNTSLAAIAFAVSCFQISLTQAQYVSRLGKFKVDQIRGCAPFTVTITTTNVITAGECTNAKPCNFDFGSGKGQQPGQNPSDFTFIYPAAGTFKLSVLYQSSGADDITIIVDPDVKPEFEIYTCSGNQVSLKVTDKTYDKYFIDFGDGSAIVTKPSGNNVVAQHAYAASGNFNISVSGAMNNGAPNCSPMVKPFTALNVLPVAPLKTLSSVDKNTLKIDFTPATNIQYKLEIAANGASNFQQFQTLYGVNTFTATTVDLDKNFYCFRLGAYDACTGINTYSSIVCTQLLTLDVQSGVNNLNWQSNGAGVTGIDVYRDSKFYASIPNYTTTYADAVINCKTKYCYYVVFKYATPTTSISLEKCGTSFTTVTPAPIADISTVTGAQRMDITWLPDPSQDVLLQPNNYSILRSINKAVHASIGTIKKITTYNDGDYKTQTNTCYRINYTDACDNQSPNGAEACPLSIEGILNKKNVITLSWNGYAGWKNGVKTYQLDKFNKDGGLISSTNVTSTTFVDDQADLVNQQVSYKITAIANDGGLIASTSNTITFIKETNLFYPTVFTPNGDGVNDTFTVSGQFIAKMDLKIYDRWGGLLYSSEKNEPWNGYINGKLLSEGAYVWKAIVTDFAGQTFSHTGTIFLITKK